MRTYGAQQASLHTSLQTTIQLYENEISREKQDNYLHLYEYMQEAVYEITMFFKKNNSSLGSLGVSWFSLFKKKSISPSIPGSHRFCPGIYIQSGVFSEAQNLHRSDAGYRLLHSHYIFCLLRICS